MRASVFLPTVVLGALFFFSDPRTPSAQPATRPRRAEEVFRADKLGEIDAAISQAIADKGCPGGVAPCGLDKIPTSADTVPLNEYFQYAVGDVMQRYRPQIVQHRT